LAAAFFDTSLYTKELRLKGGNVKVTFKAVIVAAVVTMLFGGGSAVAGSLITSAKIRDGSIRNRDIHKRTVSLNRLSPGVQALIRDHARDGVDGRNGVNGTDGTRGATGATGARGAAGPAGPKGDTGPQGPAGPAGRNGTNLPPDFFVTNTSVGLTASGVQFGPYADGGARGGSVLYTGLNGHKLSEITGLVYKAEYSTDNHTDVGVPYLRVFIDNNGDGQDDHDVIFSPNTQPTMDTAEGVVHTWDVTAGALRYDDDAGTGPDSPWADVVAAHGNDLISGVYVTAGFSAGTNLSATLKSLTVNGKTFAFGA
jgi:hypothetical protein